MNLPLTNELDTFIKTNEKKFQTDPQFKELKEASEEFQKMVDSGIIEKRGYTLLTIDQAHLSNTTFNTSLSCK